MDHFVGSGRAFATLANFAHGGSDRVESFNLKFTDSPPPPDLQFQRVRGGFGGGGRVCVEGGRGGGFEGNSVQDTGPRISGQGGLSSMLALTGVAIDDLMPTNDGDSLI